MNATSSEYQSLKYPTEGESYASTAKSRGALSAAFLVSCSAAPGHAQEHRIRNVVLVHGAWADGSGWQGVYSVYVSRPKEVAAVIEDAATHAK